MSKNWFSDVIMSKELEVKLKIYFKGKCFDYY